MKENKQSRRESCRRYHCVPRKGGQLAAGQLVFVSPRILALNFWNQTETAFSPLSPADLHNPEPRRPFKHINFFFNQKVRKSQKCEVRNKNHGINALPLHRCMLKWHSLLPGDPPLKVATLSGEIWEMVSVWLVGEWLVSIYVNLISNRNALAVLKSFHEG